MMQDGREWMVVLLVLLIAPQPWKFARIPSVMAPGRVPVTQRDPGIRRSGCLSRPARSRLRYYGHEKMARLREPFHVLVPEENPNRSPSPFVTVHKHTSVSLYSSLFPQSSSFYIQGNPMQAKVLWYSFRYRNSGMTRTYAKACDRTYG